MSKETIKELLSEFGEFIGIPELTIDDEGYCCLAFDGTVVDIEYDEETDTFTIHTIIGELPVDPSVDFYSLLLEGNYRFQKTAGATMGIDQKTKEVLLSYRHTVEALDCSQLETMFEDFVTTAEFWEDLISKPVEDEKPMDNIEVSPLPSGAIRV